MAYMDQGKKAKIAAELKKVIPKDWKYSLGVRNHSTIVLTIRSAPVDIIENINERIRRLHDNDVMASHNSNMVTNDYTHFQVNEYYLERQFSGEILTIMEKIKDALNLNNHDNSDSQTDYFDVGHYVSLNIGAWDKPFEVKS